MGWVNSTMGALNKSLFKQTMITSSRTLEILLGLNSKTILMNHQYDLSVKSSSIIIFTLVCEN